jgi:histidinol-phosphate aminotransferase
LSSHGNLVVTRTFSKAYALAGLRVGYAIAGREVIALLERLRESFNVGTLSLAGAAAALADQAHLAAGVRRNATARAALADALRARGWAVTPSQGNFVLVDFGRDAAPIEAGMLQRGVVLRPMAGYGLPCCLRISVASDAGTARLLRALDEAAA